jgi:hypothetical protein
MTNFATLQATFIKDDVSTRLQNPNHHLKRIQTLSQDSTNNDSIRLLTIVMQKPDVRVIATYATMCQK